MSNRFYVNGVQIFGNNEMFERTANELKKQGAKFNDSGFKAIEIKDPQALMDAVTDDTLIFLKERMMDYYDLIKDQDIVKSFDELSDIDVVISNMFPKELFNCLYDKEGNPEKFVWRRIEEWLSGKRFATPYTLYLAIRDDVDFIEGKLVLKEGHNIIARMY